MDAAKFAKNNFVTFKQSLKQNHPPQGLPELLEALWWDAKGDWEKAHKIAQDVHNPDGAWVHAYLHRKEGDQVNASYWYSRAGRSKSFSPLEIEWEEIVQDFLNNLK